MKTLLQVRVKVNSPSKRFFFFLHTLSFTLMKSWPDELIVQVLDNISSPATLLQLTLTSRRFCHLTTEYLWRTVYIHSNDALNCLTPNKHLFSHLTRHLCLVGGDCCVGSAAPLISQMFNLQSLQFHHSTIGQSDCDGLNDANTSPSNDSPSNSISHNSHNSICHITLSNCYFNCNPFELLAGFTRRYRRSLESIALRACEINFRFTPNSIPLTCAGIVMDRLHTLCITDNTGFTDSSFLSLLAVPQFLLPALRCLDLSGSRSITDWSLSLALKCFPQLTTIRLSNTLMSANTIDTISSTCKRLEELVVGTRDQTYRSSLSDSHWYTFMRIPDTAIRRLVSECSSLRRLYLNGCDEMDNDTVEVILLSLPMLEELDVGRSQLTQDLFSKASPQLLNALGKLKFLGLSGCAKFQLGMAQGNRTQLGALEQLIVGGRMNQLTRLDCSITPGVRLSHVYKYRSAEQLRNGVKYMSSQYIELYDMTACVLDSDQLTQLRVTNI